MAIDDCQVLVQEIDLLEHAASLPLDQRQMQVARPPPPDVMQQLLGAAANLQTQQTQRQNLQAQVFRPTVALPTVGVEQQVGLRNHGHASGALSCAIQNILAADCMTAS